MAASVGLYADTVQGRINDVLDSFEEVNLFDRGEYIHFDWGLYIAIIAVVLGAATTTLGLVAACVSARTKSEQTNQPSDPDPHFGSTEKY